MSFDWTEQVYAFPVEVGYRALVEGARNSPFTVQGTDDLRRLVSMKSGMSWRSFGEQINAQVTSRGPNECTIRIECSSAGESWGKTEQNIVALLQSINNAFHRNGQRWLAEMTPASVDASSERPPSSPKERLSHLQELLESGLISQPEYEQKRQAIIDSM